jgi:hypothetical protein
LSWSGLADADAPVSKKRLDLVQQSCRCKDRGVGEGVQQVHAADMHAWNCCYAMHLLLVPLCCCSKTAFLD